MLPDDFLFGLAPVSHRGSPAVDRCYRVESVGASGGFRALCEDAGFSGLPSSADDVLAAIAEDAMAFISEASRTHAFIHAGVVAVDGRAIVIPGPTLSGKSALVAALIVDGARYYSDEWALLDPRGLVHPYPRKLSLRPAGGGRARRVSAADLGAETGTEPIPVGWVVQTRFDSLCQAWEPATRPAGEGVLGLLANAVAGKSRPEFVFPIVSRAGAGATVLKGHRGDAPKTAQAILKRLSAAG